jgi:hypothetical protein
MKQTDNNEIELLLQSLGRRERDRSSLRGFSAPVQEGRGVSDHLDADELNSYAEGVLPAAARVRYTEHLADCGECRRIVVGLTQSTGAANPTEVLDQQSGSGFWNQLAVLFTPPVLRYAVPALVLTAVIAIGLVALRQQRRPELVAQNQPASSASPASELKPSEPLATEVAPPQRRATVSEANPSSTLEKKNSTDDRSKLSQVPAASPADKMTAASAMKDSPHTAPASGGAEPRKVFGKESPAPAPPAEQPVLSEADTGATISRAQAAEREAQERQRKDYRDQRGEESGPNRSNAAKTAASPSAGRLGVAGIRGGPSKDKKESGDEVETRIVSGRHFRREGNVWVDTAYESSRAAINVARGSEHFRSLVADEPGIRAIAEQLRGEVIVVWKGRAYRIH